MKTLVFFVAVAVLLSGCSLFYDAPRIDADLGLAQAATWDKQVAFKNYRYAGTTPEGLGGIPSEQIMKVYNQSFGEKPEKEDVFTMGIVGDSSK